MTDQYSMRVCHSFQANEELTKKGIVIPQNYS